ncbi:unnamed protein product, partial [marine sediment metagenome]
ENCNIVVEYGILSLKDCEFNDCRLTVKGPAENIIKIAKLFFPQIPIIEREPQKVVLKGLDDLEVWK